MTLEQLRDRIDWQLVGHGHYKVIDRKTGRTAITTNMTAIDRLQSDTVWDSSDKGDYRLTERQAYMILWNQLKTENQ